LAAPKLLSFGKTNKNKFFFAFHSLIRNFAANLQKIGFPLPIAPAKVMIFFGIRHTQPSKSQKMSFN